MLEHGGCEHIDDLVDPEEVTIDYCCRDNVSHMTKTAARRIVSAYRIAYGHEDARVQAATRLEMVCLCAFTFALVLICAPS